MTEDRPPIAPILRDLGRDFWAATWPLCLLMTGLTIAETVSAVLSPWLFARTIDELAAGPGAVEGLLWALLLYGLLLGISQALADIGRYVAFLCAERLEIIASTAFLGRILRKNPAFFLDHNVAEIGTARSEGTDTLNILVQMGLGGFLPGIVQIGLSVFLLGSVVNGKTALIVLVYGAVVVGLEILRARWNQGSLDEGISALQRQSQLVGNAIGLIDTLRHTRSEAWMMERFRLGAAEALSHWRAYALNSGRFAGAFGLALAAQFALTFALLLPRFEAGEISVGDIVLFNTLLLQLNQPFQMVGHAINDVARAVSKLRPFARIWWAPEDDEPEHRAPLALPDGRIVFEEAGFRYDNGRGVSGLAFSVERGRIGFVMGETGSGKSTLFKMLLKSVKPGEGRITVDGTDLADISRHDWFAHVGIVPQEIMLLNDTLSANIVLGRPHDGARLRRAAAQAAILPRIEAMQEGFDTVVGERGLKLSGGERQRIAIARALYAEPSILLLDEASSALDEGTEAEIMDGLRALSDRVTILVITHRPSVARAGDPVIRLSPGEPAPPEKDVSPPRA